MIMSLRSLSLPFILTLGLILSSCGSTSKQESEMTDPSFSSMDETSRDALKVNSDSDSGTAGSLRTVFFDFNSANLTPAARTALSNNIEFMRNNPGVRVQIEGHCDERGGVQYNLALGERRARSIRDYMVSMGIEARRMSTISFGKERPLAFGHDESAWSQNRRGNFVITTL
jgi:peptidoglycan-associated lipoprotein